MHTAVLHGNRDIRIESSGAPTPGPEDVAIEVGACGICGTDVHEYAHGPIFAPTEPHPLTGGQLPVPVGHEFGGTVLETGEAVEDIEVGDRVVVHPILSCKRCRYCEAGEYHRCREIGFVGISGVGGGFAERTVVPAENAMAVPEDLDSDAAAFVEPLAATIHALRRSAFGAGDAVAVAGAGPMGVLCLQTARAAGADPVYVSEPNPARRSIAAETGATAVFDPTETDVVDAVRDRTDDGVDLAIEVSGTEAGLTGAIKSTRRGGCVTVLGIFDQSVSIQPNDIVAPERTLVGTFGSLAGPQTPRGEFRTAARWLAAGRIDVDPLVTGRIDLEDLVARGFEELLAADTEHLKILVEP